MKNLATEILRSAFGLPQNDESSEESFGVIKLQAIWNQIRTSVNRRQITIGLITFILGFSLVTQLKVRSESSLRLASQPESDLTEIIDKQAEELRALRSEATDLQIQLVEYEASSQGNVQLVNSAKENLANMRILLGYEAVTGPGVNIIIRDRHGYLTGFDIRQLVEELRSSGAQATSINDYRIIANTSFKRKKGSIYVDNHRLQVPYNVKAIGDREVLYQSVVLPRGIKDKLSAFNGVKFEIEKSDGLFVAEVRSRN